MTRRVEDIGKDIENQLQVMAEKFVAFSLAMDESTDITDTAQLLNFIRGVTENFEVVEAVLKLCSLKERTRGTDIFEAVCAAIQEMKCQWSALTGITTDGAPSMVSEKIGLMKKKLLKKGETFLITTKKLL